MSRRFVACLLLVAAAAGPANSESSVDSDSAAKGDGFVINGGISGAWFNPQTPGQGILIEVLPVSNELFMAWFTFDSASAAKVGTSGQRWLTGLGPIAGNRVELVLTLTAGGAFDSSQAVSNEPAGSATIEFAGCTEARFDYVLDAEALSGGFDLQRLAPDVLCAELAAGPEDDPEDIHQGAGNFTILSDDTALATTLSLPPGPGRHPVVVVVHGSGLATRSNVQFIVNLLVPRGFAALSYDKRGVGQSEGVFVEAGALNNRLHVLADDVLAMLDFLRLHAEIDDERMGLLGISQGGWVNAIVGASAPDLAFMVSVVGPTVTIGEEIHYSSFTDSGATILEASNAVRDYSGPRGYDPIPDLQTIQFPALWVLGGLDRSIPTDITIERLNVLIDGGSPFEIQLHPNGNHGLRDPQGNPIPYLTPPGGVFDWIESVIGDAQR